MPASRAAQPRKPAPVMRPLGRPDTSNTSLHKVMADVRKRLRAAPRPAPTAFDYNRLHDIPSFRMPPVPADVRVNPRRRVQYEARLHRLFYSHVLPLVQQAPQTGPLSRRTDARRAPTPLPNVVDFCTHVRKQWQAEYAVAKRRAKRSRVVRRR